MLYMRQKWAVAVLFLVIVSLSLGPKPMPVVAQAESAADFGALKEDVERIKADLEEIKKDLKLMREFLMQRLAQPARTAPVVAQVSLAGNPVLGTNDAPITVIEFSDYQCPYCQKFFQTTLPALKTEYIETGKVRYVYRDFPLDQIHPYARKAAEAAHCAGEQGKYWAMHDMLFQNQQALEAEQLKGYARSLQLESTAFDTCLEQGKYTAEVQKDYEDGVTAGVRGTPGFFIGKTDAEDTIQGTLITGAQPLTIFRQAIEGLLREN